MNLEIVRKTEAWKFSPIAMVNGLNVRSTDELKPTAISDVKVAIGPNEQQIHTVLIQDLIDSGTIELSSKSADQYFYNDSNTERANLDRNLEDIHKFNNTNVLTFVKQPQSIIWLDPNSLSSNLEIVVKQGLNVSFVFFETDTQDFSTQDSSFYKIAFTIEDNANLELGINQSAPKNSLSLINVNLGKDAHFNSYSLMTGGAAYKRLELNVFQKGPNSSATLNGLNATKNKGIFDYHSNVFHLAKDQETFQNFKAVCKDTSKSIFSGRVHLTENCSGANVDQINNNLLLDKKSSVDTQPELNIYQDNVKATHGATTSSLDESHIFYFSSRGFKPEQTKKMLLDAFCKSTCDNLKTEGIKTFFKQAISKELYGA